MRPDPKTRLQPAAPRRAGPPLRQRSPWLRRLGHPVAALCLVGLGLWAGSKRGDDPSDALTQLAGRVAALDQTVARERQERAALAREVARLQAEVAQERPQEARAPATPSAGAPGPAPGVASPAPAAPPGREAAAAAPQPASFDAQRLRGSGIAASEVDRYRARLAEIELDRLQLRDRAAREGWLDSPRFVEESEGLDEASALDGEFDDEFQDWMRYAAGQPNRLAVTEVLPGSQAERAGLQPGDLLLRYGGERLLAPENLGAATAAGVAGAWTDVEVQRGAETLLLRVPRGPLGVAVDALSAAPTPRDASRN